MLSAEPSGVRPDLSGRTIVITGANTGVGRAAAEALASRGAEVILACRSEARTRPMLEALSRSGSARWVAFDAADLSSVRRAADALAPLKIDVLINNAGVGGARGLTKDGFELAFGTNHLGHYLWTRLLLPSLARGGRVVHLGSGSYRHARGLDFRALERPTRTLTGVFEYAASKLAVMLFHAELDERLRRESARGIRSLVADPGNVASEAYRHLPCPLRALWMLGMKSPARGALTPIHCATAPDLTSGCYVDGRPFVPDPHARDRALASELWTRSAAWVGVPDELR